MLGTTELDYIQHLERGYCVNHPDVIAQTKEQVVDRAVKQLLEALQSNGYELDGDILKRGDGWIKYDAGAWQYSNDAGETWAEIGSGGAGNLLTLPDQSAFPSPVTGNSQILSKLVYPPDFKLYIPPNLTLPTLMDHSVWCHPITNHNCTIDSNGDIVFNGTSAYIEAPHSNDWNIPYDPFCIEFSFFLNSVADCTIIAHNAGNNDWGYFWSIRLVDAKLSFYRDNSLKGQSNTVFTTGSWHRLLLHISAQAKWMSYIIDGNWDNLVQDTPTFENPLDTLALLRIGVNDTNSIYYSGMLRDIRIVRGRLLYPSETMTQQQALVCVHADGRQTYVG
jgi:hypothetical protein